MRMNWEIRVQPNGDGTDMTQSCEVVPPDESPLAGMINEDTARQGREEATTNLMRLKAIIEAQLA